MLSTQDGRMIILSSPSGAGKTTLVKKISEEKKYYISISHTTREPRKNEVDGVDYFFVSNDKFQELIKNNEFLEHADVFKNLYGSTKKQVFEHLDKGLSVLFDIDWQGAQQIKNQTLKYEMVSFFILPPSKEVLLQRLITRGENEDETIQLRMQQFDKDVLHWKDYDFVVINEDLNNCYNQIIGYLEKRAEYNKEEIENHINKLI